MQTATEILAMRDAYWKEQLPKVAEVLKPFVERQAIAVRELLVAHGITPAVDD